MRQNAIFVKSRSLSIQGTRLKNEDAVLSLSSPGLFCVADGVGGHSKGEYVSSKIVENLEKLVIPPPTGSDNFDIGGTDIEFCLKETHSSLQSEFADCKSEPPMSTASVLFIDTKKFLMTICHVGDSRIYRLRNKQLKQLTPDHTYLEKIRQELGDQDFNLALIDENLTKAIGMHGELELFRSEEAVQPDDVFLICSDGLTKHVNHEQIKAVLTQPFLPLRIKLERLVGKTQPEGPTDNLSVVLVQVRDKLSRRIIRDKKLLSFVLGALILFVSGITTSILTYSKHQAKIEQQDQNVSKLFKSPVTLSTEELEHQQHIAHILNHRTLPQISKNYEPVLAQRSQEFLQKYRQQSKKMLKEKSFRLLKEQLPVLSKDKIISYQSLDSATTRLIEFSQKKEALSTLWWKLQYALKERQFQNAHRFAQEYWDIVSLMLSEGPVKKLISFNLSELTTKEAVRKLLADWPFSKASDTDEIYNSLKQYAERQIPQDQQSQ